MKNTNEMKIINEIFSHLGEGWFINEKPGLKLVGGYCQLISKNEVYKNFSMYCCMANEKIYINACVFDELNGVVYSADLKKGAFQLAKLIRKNVISQKHYLFSIVNNRK